MTNSRLENKLMTFLKFLISFSISLKLSLIPHEVFKDRANYLIGLAYSEKRFVELFDNIGVKILFQEPLFKISNYLLSFSLEHETILSLYAFLNCFCVLSFVLYNRKSFNYSLISILLLMLTPYFFATTLGSLRQGLGFNLILISFMRRDSILSNKFAFTLFLASLFHVIFFVFLFLTLSYRFTFRFVKNQKLLYFLIFVIVICIGLGWKFVTPLLASKQQYDEFEQSNSGLTFIGWFLLFIPFLYNYLYLRKSEVFFHEAVYQFALFMFICFLIFYWFAPGPYRILYSTMPLVIYALFNNRSLYSILSLVFITLYSLILIAVGAGSGSMNISYIEFIRIFFSISTIQVL